MIKKGTKVGIIECLKEEIERIIQRSAVPEDPVHAKNTLEWLLKFKPDADEGLKIAALGHDIERAVEKRKVRRQDYKSYDAFKHAHALNSAKILAEIMEDCKIEKELVDDIFTLVSQHETGGNNRMNVLRDADSISFFQINLPYYFARNGVEETKERYLWGYRKLPDRLKELVAGFKYPDKELQSLVKIWIAGSG
jgi:hypothetical protein